MLTPIIFDVNIFVAAVAGGENPFRSWPSPPPTSSNPCADCLGIIVDAAEFSLWVSPHILKNVSKVLTEQLEWDAELANKYEAVIVSAVQLSGGSLVDPPVTVGDCKDYEDNRILDLAVDVGALLVVSEDVDLTSMSPWRGTPILRAREFAAKVDAMRRHRRRNP